MASAPSAVTAVTNITACAVESPAAALAGPPQPGMYMLDLTTKTLKGSDELPVTELPPIVTRRKFMNRFGKGITLYGEYGRAEGFGRTQWVFTGPRDTRFRIITLWDKIQICATVAVQKSEVDAFERWLLEQVAPRAAKQQCSGRSLPPASCTEAEAEMVDHDAAAILSGKRIAAGVPVEELLMELHLTALHGGRKATALLRDALGVHVNSKNPKDGKTALHVSWLTGDLETTRLLLASPHIDVNARDSEGAAPLHDAAFYGHADAVGLLLGVPHIDVNAKDAKGQTPLRQMVLGFGNSSDDRMEAAARALLADPRVLVNEADAKGDTPLHAATRAGATVFAQMLLAHPQCDSRIRNHKNKTPLRLAQIWGTLSIELTIQESRKRKRAHEASGGAAADGAGADPHAEAAL